MAESILPHFAIGWRTFKAHSGIFVVSMLALFASWVTLEVAVISLQCFGLIVWLVLHLAFFFFVSGLMVWFCRLSLKTVKGEAPELSDLTASLHRGPIFLLAACIYLAAVACGLAMLLVPGIYVVVRYALFGQVVATRSTRAVECLQDAAMLVRGHWWTLCFFLCFALLLNLAGAAFLGIGLVLTFPVSILATSDLYRSLEQSAKQ